MVARVVKEKLKGAASGVPLMSLAPAVILALYVVLGAKSAEGLKAANPVRCIVSDRAGHSRNHKASAVNACRIHGLAEDYGNGTVRAHSVGLGDHYQYRG